MEVRALAEESDCVRSRSGSRSIIQRAPISGPQKKDKKNCDFSLARRADSPVDPAAGELRDSKKGVEQLGGLSAEAEGAACSPFLGVFSSVRFARRDEEVYAGGLSGGQHSAGGWPTVA
jgi:hypothetical protein